ncbi:MAG: hypothetical protein ACLR71_02840 [[Clostridium] scindens]
MADAWKSQESRIDKNGDGKLQYVMLEGEQVHQDSLIRTEYSVKTILNEGIVTEMPCQWNWQLDAVSRV